MAVSFKTVKSNMKLTDFDDIKDIVITNSVKGVPDGLKKTASDDELVLAGFM